MRQKTVSHILASLLVPCFIAILTGCGAVEAPPDVATLAPIVETTEAPREASSPVPSLPVETAPPGGFRLVRETHTITNGDWTNIVVIEYNENGDTVFETASDSTGHTTREEYTYDYDAEGRLLLRVYTNSNGTTGTTEKSYDAAGNMLTQVFSANGGTNRYEYTYDADGNILSLLRSTSDGFTSSQEFTYDENGHVLLVEFTEGDDTPHRTEYTYDVDGTLIRMSGSEFGGGSDTTYERTWDSHGNLLMETEYHPNWSFTITHTYTYDDAGNILSDDATDSDGRRWSICSTYDEWGNPLTYFYNSMNSDGITTENDYDNYTYEYDAQGRMLSEMCKGSHGYYSLKTWSYDTEGRLLRETKTISGDYRESRVYTYDDFGNLVEEVRENKQGSDDHIIYEYAPVG